MARIELAGVSHAYVAKPGEEDYVLRGADLRWEDGVAYALLGPSGCGKTTLLNILSGLLVPSEGRVLFDGEDVTARVPRERNVAQVFQFPVVYDAMRVEDNLAFPLRNRGVPEADVLRRVAEVAEALELGPFLRHRAEGLSPDLKQIISLGRGLVRADVAAILFDEPLTVIDPHQKWKLRCKLRAIYERFRLTLIYVTHDQTEALTFADQILVMKDGAILQQGTPEELFEEPAHEFVGYFIGSPGMNFLRCVADGDELVIAGRRVAHPAAGRAADGAELRLGIRPAHVELRGEDCADAVPVTVERVEDLGNHLLCDCAFGDERLKVRTEEDREVRLGPAFCRFPETMARLYADGELVG